MDVQNREWDATPLPSRGQGRLPTRFEATIQNNGTQIAYILTYNGLSSPVTQAHIHFGRPAISGQIVLFLCTNVGLPAGVSVPTPPACPSGGGTVTGTLTAANVIARTTQGIDAGAAGLAEMLKAISAGAAYANVHTMMFPTGEIRGRLRGEDSEGD